MRRETLGNERVSTVGVLSRENHVSRRSRRWIETATVPDDIARMLLGPDRKQGKTQKVRSYRQAENLGGANPHQRALAAFVRGRSLMGAARHGVDRCRLLIRQGPRHRGRSKRRSHQSNDHEDAIRTSPRRNGTRAIAGKVKSPRRRRLSATGLDRPWSRRGARRRSEAGIKPALSLPPAIATMTKPKIIFSCDVSPKRQGGQNCGSVVSLASKTRRVDETVSRGYSEHHGEQ
jgi:hypothetical protein